LTDDFRSAKALSPPKMLDAHAQGFPAKVAAI
jgi:hypothetical protein